MRKALSYILPLLVAFVALIPPIRFRIPAPAEHWPLLVACAGFLGIRILFMRVNPFVKAAALLSFISCFFSSIPYLSFNTYVVIVAHLYLYIGLTMMDSWRPMFAVVKSLLVYNALLIVLQATGNDQMLNWSLDAITCYGITGQHMQMGSYSVILGCLLGILSPLFWIFPIVAAFFCNSSWTLLCVGAGIGTWSIIRKKWLLVALGAVICAVFVGFALKTNKIQGNLSQGGRLGVWKESIQLLNDKPWTGWGPGTYKGAFPSLSKAFFNRQTVPWRSAHNDWVQLGFEFGYPVLAIALIAWFFIFLILLKKSWMPGGAVLAAGFVMLSLDMMVHFPTRLAELCPMMLAFLAYVDCWLKNTPKKL